MALPMFSENRPAIKNYIAIAAGKGGVGKSSVTVNLALSLQQKGFSVGVLDMDIYGPSIRKMLPEDSLPSQNGDAILPALSRGIKVISFAYFRKEEEASAVRAPIANGIVSQFIDKVSWGNLDYLLIDFPPGTGDVQLTVGQKLPLTGAVIVTTPQDVSLIDVRKAINLFDQMNVPVIGIVENMSFFQQGEEKVYIFGKGGGARLAKEKGVPLLGQIPIDPLVCQCGDSGESLFLKKSKVGLIYHDMTEETIRHLETLKNGMKSPIPQAIELKDDHTLSIKWSDGSQQELLLSELQKNCPCAACVDESTGQRLKDPSQIDEKVTTTRVESVGRYALKITFTSGCSTGIYHFDYLKQLGNPSCIN